MEGGAKSIYNLLMQKESVSSEGSPSNSKLIVQGVSRPVNAADFGDMQFDQLGVPAAEFNDIQQMVDGNALRLGTMASRRNADDNNISGEIGDLQRDLEGGHGNVNMASVDEHADKV